MRFLKFIYGQSNSSDKVVLEIQEECICSSDSGFFVTKRQASYISAGVVFLFISIFITGYFWGKKSAIHEFGNNVLNGSFADQAKYSFYSLYGSPIEESEESEEDEAQPQESEIEKATTEANDIPATVPTEAVIKEENNKENLGNKVDNKK